MLDDFTILQAGKQLHYLVENLDVVTYYMFRVGTNDSSGNYHFCEVLVKTLRDGECCLPILVNGLFRCRISLVQILLTIPLVFKTSFRTGPNEMFVYHWCFLVKYLMPLRLPADEITETRQVMILAVNLIN